MKSKKNRFYFRKFHLKCYAKLHTDQNENINEIKTEKCNRTKQRTSLTILISLIVAILLTKRLIRTIAGPNELYAFITVFLFFFQSIQKIWYEYEDVVWDYVQTFEIIWMSSENFYQNNKLNWSHTTTGFLSLLLKSHLHNLIECFSIYYVFLCMVIHFESRWVCIRGEIQKVLFIRKIRSHSNGSVLKNQQKPWCSFKIRIFCSIAKFWARWSSGEDIFSQVSSRQSLLRDKN